MHAAADSTAADPDREHVRLSDIAIGVIIGRTSEFFDFFVFAIAAVLVFPQFIFSFAAPAEGILYAFLVLALGFVARPVGTFFFTGVDRRWGRGTKLTSALFLLGLSTVAISFLPSFEQEGWLTVASLCLFRMGQGAALGGAWDGMSSLLSLHAPADRKGRYATLPQIGAPLGLILACGLFIFLRSSLSEAEFLRYGWRYPFFVAFAINVVALFARLRLVVSDDFELLFKQAELRPRINPRLLREESLNIIAGAFIPLATLALFHMVTVFPLSWIYLNAPENITGFLWIEIVGGLIGLGGIVASGFIADRTGRRSLLRNCAIGIAVYAVISPLLLSLGFSGEALYVFIGFALLGLSFGQSSGAVASGFAMKNRYTASNLTADLSWMFGAGFAPFVALYLTETFGLWSSGAYLLSGALCTLAALVLFRRTQEARRQQDSSWR
ncbi:Predicted arabinose efflux permease, MFS family [Paracoccus isoporae]|uniref:Predicted arabinose efflux permease, MFS family n=1 Tax=Paracoccus isoporae TaxID=591205 RepID=A0A1G6ULI6_9RHOB|nr:MFS transporter [Paracoccus isoporae]SDD42218.1 Predicted arabinose efflux permease, MFS family [Paracoccus isoporae]